MSQTPKQKVLPAQGPPWRTTLDRLTAGIGTKIVLPYLLLALAVGGVGAFVVTNLVTNSLQERFNNQLLDAGRIVAESMVGFEEERLEALRAVAGTRGVAEGLAAGDRGALAALVPQILVNSGADAVELLDGRGIEIYGWQRPPGRRGEQGVERSGADFSGLAEVGRVLAGFVDQFGDKRAMLVETDYGPMLFTVGPVYLDGGIGDREQVGTVMVGTYVHDMVLDLSETAVARVTLYDREGGVVDTSLGSGQEGVRQTLQELPGQYARVIELLRESPDRYAVVAGLEDQVLLRVVQVLGQQYVLAYGDWRLRGQSFGLFSVALPSNFIVSTASVSRKWLSLLFSVATLAVFALGFGIAQRLIRPLHRLVQTSVAVAQGDLAQRTGIESNDEIGSLARSFDAMTERLAERNRQLVEQAHELRAILNGIADGVVVLDTEGRILNSNPAAQRIMAEVSPEILLNVLHESPPLPVNGTKAEPKEVRRAAAPPVQQLQRYQVNDRVLSALAAPVVAPDGQEVRTVVVLRDVTREALVEQLKDGFIVNVSHELRTPLTAIKGYSDLLSHTNRNLDENQRKFVQIINNNANQLVGHVNKLIDISQIQSMALGLRQERLSFTGLVEEMAEGWRERMESKGLSLQLRSSGEPLWVDGDPARLKWAVDNLLSNACNYTLDGGHVEVRACRENERARLDVADSGVGVAVADQPYLFSRFFRANNESTFDVRGVGLGLFITRSIVELHGGSVWAESQLGVGSTFSLALPLTERDALVEHSLSSGEETGHAFVSA
jgi:signal transduction histidine kinase